MWNLLLAFRSLFTIAVLLGGSHQMLQPGGEAADGHGPAQLCPLGQHHLPAGPVLHPSYLGLGIPYLLRTPEWELRHETK